MTPAKWVERHINRKQEEVELGITSRQMVRARHTTHNTHDVKNTESTHNLTQNPFIR